MFSDVPVFEFIGKLSFRKDIEHFKDNFCDYVLYKCHRFVFIVTALVYRVFSKGYTC